MNTFIFSADAHVNEPAGLFEERLPAGLRDAALHIERKDGYMNCITGDRLIHRMQLADGVSADIGLEKRSGGSNIEMRLNDMARDGIDAEHIYPQLMMLAWALPRELAVAHAEVYNDWVISHFSKHLDRFVPSAVLSCFDPAETLGEIKQCKAKGFRSVMMPVVLPKDAPKYNSALWDQVWQAISDTGMVVNMHLATGDELVSERGSGAAIINYTRMAFHVMDTITVLISSGVFERFPKIKVVHAEAGASWMRALGERLDEAFIAHKHYVSPKLKKLPSQYLYNNIVAGFQFDNDAVENRKITGTDCLIWCSDYPHLEGTFPNSKKVIDQIFNNVPVSDADKEAILGGNAAKLYGLTPKKFILN